MACACVPGVSHVRVPTRAMYPAGDRLSDRSRPFTTRLLDRQCSLRVFSCSHPRCTYLFLASTLPGSRTSTCFGPAQILNAQFVPPTACLLTCSARQRFTLFEPQSRIGDKLLEIRGNLSPKQNCASKMVKTLIFGLRLELLRGAGCVVLCMYTDFPAYNTFLNMKEAYVTPALDVKCLVEVDADAGRRCSEGLVRVFLERDNLLLQHADHGEHGADVNTQTMGSTKLMVGCLPPSTNSTASANGVRSSLMTPIRCQSSLLTSLGGGAPSDADLSRWASIALRFWSRLLSMATSDYYLVFTLDLIVKYLGVDDPCAAGLQRNRRL